MGLKESYKRWREEQRYGNVPEPFPGTKIFTFGDWRWHEIERYCENAKAAGYNVEMLYGEDAAWYREEMAARSGYRVAQASWWVTVWHPSQPKPLPWEELA